MAAHPIALDATTNERRALRFKCFTFYGKWEPNKSVQDVNDLCEWALENGVSAFNAKLRAKYGEDLAVITVNSYLDLPLETQLKLFYSEYDPNKNPKEINDVATWARQRGNDGIVDINIKMNRKYGENLNTMAFGGRSSMRHLLDAYFKKVDPKRGTPENIQTSIDYVVIHGALALIRELVERYKIGIQLSISEIEGRPLEIEPISNRTTYDAPRPAIMSLMRGSQVPVNPAATSAPAAPIRPLSVALSVTSSNKNKAIWSVSEDAEIRGLMEIFYAKNNPEKLGTGGVDALLKYARVNGLEAVNVKLQDKYGEDLDSLKVQYTSLVEELRKYYGKVDPTKKNIEDVAAWAIVHGTQPLSDRLEKRYGRGLYDEDPESSLDTEVLRVRLQQFYQTFDQKPKNDQDLDTIIAWVMSTSLTQLNKKLKEKYGANLNDLPPLEVGETVVVPATATKKEATVQTIEKAEDGPPAPEVLPTSPVPLVQQSGKVVKTPPSTPPPKFKSPLEQVRNQRDRTNSFGSVAGEDSMSNVEEQMIQMRRVTSGQYDDLGRKIRAFYRRNDPSKLDNKEALDLVMKWTFKHGLDALNKKFNTHYGKTLDDVDIDDNDDELEEEGDDYIPDW